MEETSKTVATQELLSHSDLIDLYKHYWSVILAELSFCHQYLNFYSGLLSAILAATLAGLLSIKFRGWDELVLLLGPLLVFILAHNGYSTVETFYHRFVQAWVTTINLQSMLHIRYSTEPIHLGYEPRYISNHQSFIPTMEDPRIRSILEEVKGGKRAEQVTKELIERKGTTLRNANTTFIAFKVAAVILVAFIVLTFAFPSLFQQWLP